MWKVQTRLRGGIGFRRCLLPLTALVFSWAQELGRACLPEEVAVLPQQRLVEQGQPLAGTAAAKVQCALFWLR